MNSFHPSWDYYYWAPLNSHSKSVNWNACHTQLPCQFAAHFPHCPHTSIHPSILWLTSPVLFPFLLGPLWYFSAGKLQWKFRQKNNKVRIFWHIILKFSEKKFANFRGKIQKKHSSHSDFFFFSKYCQVGHTIYIYIYIYILESCLILKTATNS